MWMSGETNESLTFHTEINSESAEGKPGEQLQFQSQSAVIEEILSIPYFFCFCIYPQSHLPYTEYVMAWNRVSFHVTNRI